MKRPSPGFEQNQTDCLPAARLPGKEGCMKNNQNISKKQCPYLATTYALLVRHSSFLTQPADNKDHTGTDKNSWNQG